MNVTEEPGGGVPDHPDPLTAEASPHTQSPFSADDLSTTRPFQTFEKRCGVEFSFNGQAIAKTGEWECIVSPSGSVMVTGIRVRNLFDLIQPRTQTELGVSREFSIGLLQAYALKRGSLLPEVNKAAKEAAALLAEIGPWLPRLRAYCAQRPVRLPTKKMRSGARSLLGLSDEKKL